MAQFNHETQEFGKNSGTWFEVAMLADNQGVPTSLKTPLSVRFGDSPNITAFGRLRVSEARLLGEYRYQYGSGTPVEMNDLIAGGGTLVADYNRNCFIANVGTASGDRVVRQTKQYHPYITGTSNFAMMTFTMNAPKENLQQSVGLFDDQNGIFLRLNGLTPEFVIRRGGYDMEVVPQDQWSGDKLDGTGPSGVTIDFSKSQIFAIDYQWLGVGRVRVGFEIEGNLVRVHEFLHSNEIEEVYMHQPSLPCRWEIKNVGVTDSPSKLMIICGAVYCEGAESETGFVRSVSTDSTPVSIKETTGHVVLAVRLKNTLAGKNNHAMACLKRWSVVSTEDVNYRIIIFNDDSKFVTPSWQNVPGYSWCEYTKNVALTADWDTNNDFTVIENNFAVGGQRSNSGSSSSISSDNKTNAVYQNYDSTNSQVLAIVAHKISSNATVSANFSWLEIK